MRLKIPASHRLAIGNYILDWDINFYLTNVGIFHETGTIDMVIPPEDAKMP